MHILFISHRPPFPPNKGEKIRTFNQILNLRNKGHTISVCAPVSNQTDIADMNTLADQHCNKTAYAQAPGKLNMALALLQGRPLSNANFYTGELQKKIDSMLLNDNIDVIICTSSSMAEYVFNSNILHEPNSPKPFLIMDFMDLDSDKWKQYQAIKPFPLSTIYGREAKLLAEYERKIHREFDASLFISQNEIDIFLQNAPNLSKLHPIANGLDTDFFQATPLRSQIDSPVLLFTGVMDYFPNCDAVIWFVENCWQQILNQWPGAQFYIAGMNPNHKVRELAKRQGVTVTGFVEDIREYYQKADFFVAPFRIARGVQNKVLQAFACGLPVVSTPIGCEGIKCKNEQDVLQAETPAEFVQRLEQLVTDKSLAEKIRNNALNLVQSEFSWEGCLKPLNNMLSHYEQTKLQK